MKWLFAVGVVLGLAVGLLIRSQAPSLYERGYHKCHTVLDECTRRLAAKEG